MVWSGENCIWGIIEEVAKTCQPEVKRIPSALLTLRHCWPRKLSPRCPPGSLFHWTVPYILNLFIECTLLPLLRLKLVLFFSQESTPTEPPWAEVIVWTQSLPICKPFLGTPLLLWGPCDPALPHLSDFTYSPLIHFSTHYFLLKVLWRLSLRC